MKIFKKTLKFIKEVLIEAKRVSWPTWRETSIIVCIVAVVVLIASLFFLCVDYVIYNIVMVFFLNF